MSEDKLGLLRWFPKSISLVFNIKKLAFQLGILSNEKQERHLLELLEASTLHVGTFQTKDLAATARLRFGSCDCHTVPIWSVLSQQERSESECTTIALKVYPYSYTNEATLFGTSASVC